MFFIDNEVTKFYTGEYFTDKVENKTVPFRAVRLVSFKKM